MHASAGASGHLPGDVLLQRSHSATSGGGYPDNRGRQHIITNFIAYRGSLGRREKLEPLAGPDPAGAVRGAGPTAREPAGQYDQAFCARKMQAEDMKNAKLFLQYGPLSAATIEKFDQWRDDTMRVA